MSLDVYLVAPHGPSNAGVDQEIGRQIREEAARLSMPEEGKG